ncbi:hypothetical protein DFP73DRAFT_589893 [Morchella snyderi]|nr:hypothetical protein DFP73DRAFT_589893 [Morchella snyderi]
MASYEDDHNIRGPVTYQPPPRQRIDLSGFFATLDLANANSSGGGAAEDNEAPFRSLAAAFRELPDTPVREGLLQQLLSEAGDPGAKVQGVPDSFFDRLERVPKNKLKKDDTCSICNTAFLDDPYPLVVVLPCHAAHMFDLECIHPWLKLHSTCPLDRIDLLKKKEPIPPPVDDDEEEWDENYG